MKVPVEINADILMWALHRAGFTVDEISKSFPKFPAWLKGDKPTIIQLKNFAAKVHVPFGYLFLEDIPKEEIPIPFFRTTGSNDSTINLNVYDTINLLKQRQLWLSEFLASEGYDKLEFVGSYKRNDDINDIVQDIYKTLGLAPNWASEYDTWTISRNKLIEKVTDSGIMVSANSVVGNNTHRKIKVEDCRGFVLIDDYAPFMFINSADAKSAQMFTIAHELAHIWIGKSAGFDYRQLIPADDPTEIFCDQIAAEFLVPKDLFLDQWDNNCNIQSLARHFKVSKIVIARRALDLGLMSKDDFFAFYNQHIAKEFQKKQNQSGGGDFNATLKQRLGHRYISYINQAVKENKLLLREAYDLTGLKGSSFHKFRMFGANA